MGRTEGQGMRGGVLIGWVAFARRRAFLFVRRSIWKIKRGRCCIDVMAFFARKCVYYYYGGTLLMTINEKNDRFWAVPVPVR